MPRRIRYAQNLSKLASTSAARIVAASSSGVILCRHFDLFIQSGKKNLVRFSLLRPFGPAEFSTYTTRDFRMSTEIKKMDDQVEQYVERQSSPQKEIVSRLRKVILRTFPDVKEEMKMGVPWYEGKLYVVALKDHVNLGFCLKGLSQKEKRLLEGSGRTMKHVKIHSLKDIDDKKIEDLLMMVRERWS